MILMAGLGNPGKKYQGTRHNVGFFVIEKLREKLKAPAWKNKEKFKAEMSKFNNLLLAKPQTWMNNSGISVALLTNFYKITPDNIWIIHDDIDIALGNFKIQKNRRSAGHKGVQSIIEMLGTQNFNRLRLGIKSDQQGKIPPEKFVLQKFSPKEKKILNKIVPQALNTLKEKIKI